jgi:ABC-type polysaccharide/polyol phosphate export permease
MIISLIYYFVLTVVKSSPDARSLLIGVSMYKIFRGSFQSGVSSVNDFSGGLKGERVRSRVLTRSTLWHGIIDNTIRASGIAVVLFIGFGVSLEGVVAFLVMSEIMGFLAQGVGMNLTLMAKRFPDVNHLVFYFLRLMFFCTPVLYPMSITSGLHYRVNEFFPFSYFVEFVRYVVGLDSVVLDFAAVPTIPILVVVIVLAYRGYSSIDRLRWEVSSWS